MERPRQGWGVRRRARYTERMIPFTNTPASRASSVEPMAGARNATAGGAGVVSGAPLVLLRAEGALVLAGAVLAYHHLGGSWWLFALLFLAPDLSMLGYLAGPRAGAIAYDAVHTYLAPAALALLGLVAPAVLPFAVIWFGHLGFDRLQGYGLKYATRFSQTHLGARRSSDR